MMFNKYTITYKDENGSIIKTDEILFKENDSIPPYEVDAAYTPKNPEQKFAGWEITEGVVAEGECDTDKENLYVCENEETITVRENIILEAYVLE